MLESSTNATQTIRVRSVGADNNERYVFHPRAQTQDIYEAMSSDCALYETQRYSIASSFLGIIVANINLNVAACYKL